MEYFHVRISQKSSPSYDETRLDIGFEELEARFLVPYRIGSTIVINGKSIPINDIDRIRISKSSQNSDEIRPIVKDDRRRSNVVSLVVSEDWEIARKGDDVTDEFITGPPGGESEPSHSSSKELRPTADSREVFVVHGRNDYARNSLFQFLRSIDLHPLEWTEAVQSTGKASPYIGEILDAAFSRAHAIVVLFTPDDEARLREALRRRGDPDHETQLTGQARSNVLFEAGMAMGRSEDRTVLVEVGLLRPFSDVAGRHVIRLDDSTQRRQELAQRLGIAGCPIKLDGTDWHRAGDFDAVLRELVPETLARTDVTQEGVSSGGLPGLSDDEITLLVDGAEDPEGTILKFKTMGGTFIQVNGEVYGDPEDPRSVARWEAAIRNLLSQGFVEDTNGNDRIFQITHDGYTAADGLRRSIDTDSS